jgi:hypothetical protein
LLPATAAAVTCHCFRDRTYDPAAPGKAEPYLLATTANSLLAAVQGIPRGDLVRALMGGATPHDLWVAHRTAGSLGRDASALLKERAAGRSWALILGDGRGLGEGVRLALAGGGGEEAVAVAVAEEVLASRLGATPRELAELGLLTGSFRERILAVVAARLTGRPATELVGRVKTGRETWGGILHAAGIAPGEMESRIPPLLGK